MTAVWTTSTVGEQFDVQLGKMLDAAKNVGIPKPYLGNRAIQWGRIDVAARGIVPMTRSDLQRYRLREGDLLVCEGGEVGRGAIWQNQLPECYYQKALHRLRAKSGYDARLMLALLHYWSSVGAFSDFVTQTSIAHLPREKFVQMPLPLPSKVEQCCIGDALQDADDLIATQERIITKKQAVKQGMIQRLFAGRSHAPSGWRDCCLGENLLGPPRYGINAAAVPLRPGIGTYIRITDINDDGRFDPHPKVGVSHPNAPSYILKTGELVIARTGASVGKSYLYDPRDGELVYAGFLINIAPDPRRLNPKFLALFMQTADYWNWVARTSMRTGQPGINGSEYAQLPLALPSIDIQNDVAKKFADVDQQIEALERRLHKSIAIKTAMMQQLLTGRARLRAESAL
ncbi:restriction endonuclease subunit S [Mycobacterium rhizamassiliense]|uniref:restriction endonuclease subunit S n=1 Tax=Mycobacterium rhizamassiliense TaxID=1841860 RepID=UPI00097D1485|nr:restriction endonuclease subunit S [Mycobacterium rhizamassiliense]